MNGISAEEFFTLVDNGWEIIPTDKNNKLYLSTDDKICKVFLDNWSEEDKQKFIQYDKEKKFIFYPPGYFYILPYFMNNPLEQT